jgi:hypothetical protein
MTRRPELVAFAAALDGIGANPARDRARYLDLIAPNETPERAAEMAGMWGCALVARGILRAFITHPIFAAPYRDRRAMSDLVDIARDAGALHPPSRVPEPGDFVIVGGGEDGGGPEHVYMALPDGDGVDGGQRDDAGYQVIRIRKHELRDGWDSARDDGHPAGRPRRVRWVVDCEQVLAALG